MKKLLNYIWSNMEKYWILFLFIILLCLVFLQIFSRIFMKPIIWTEEISRLVFIWMVFFGLGYVTKKRTHLCLEVVTNHFNIRQKAIFDIIIGIFSIAILIYVGYWSIKYVEFVWINKAPATNISMGIYFIIAPISMVIGVVRLIENVTKDIQALKSKS